MIKYVSTKNEREEMIRMDDDHLGESLRVW